jgi:hypothetical protein
MRSLSVLFGLATAIATYLPIPVKAEFKAYKIISGQVWVL